MYSYIANAWTALAFTKLFLRSTLPRISISIEYLYQIKSNQIYSPETEILFKTKINQLAWYDH